LSNICGCGLSLILDKPTFVGEFYEQAFKSFSLTNFATEKQLQYNINNTPNLTRGSLDYLKIISVIVVTIVKIEF
jgi:hypothetical protein